MIFRKERLALITKWFSRSSPIEGNAERYTKDIYRIIQLWVAGNTPLIFHSSHLFAGQYSNCFTQDDHIEGGCGKKQSEYCFIY